MPFTWSFRPLWIPRFSLRFITPGCFQMTKSFGNPSPLFPCLTFLGFSREASMPFSNSDEHKGGPFPNYSSKAKYFSSFITSNNLLDVGYIGPCFTWCNIQEGLAPRWARLDRFLANSSWFWMFNFISNQHLTCLNLDHSPLFLTARIVNLSPNKIF